MKQKLVALNLDRMILQPLTPQWKAAVSALQQLRAGGTPIVLTSSHHHRSIAATCQQMQLQSPLITTNGCELWGTDGRLLDRRVLPWSSVHKIHTIAAQLHIRYRAYCAEGVFESATQQHLPQLDYSWLQMSLFADQPLRSRPLLERLQRIRHIDTIVHAPHHTPFQIDVVPAGVNKATAMEHICRTLQLDKANVTAFGDNAHDIGMLQWAGCGIAMQDAADDVRSAADHVITTPLQEGLSTLLLRLQHHPTA